MRQLVLLLLLSLIGCDTSGIDPTPLTDTLIVDFEDGSVLRLTTEGAPGCMTPMIVDTDVSSDKLAVDVLGLEVPEGPVCLAIIPSTWTVDVPPIEGSLDIEIAHRGETDLYVIRDTVGGLQFSAVRTSSTRPGPR